MRSILRFTYLPTMFGLMALGSVLVHREAAIAWLLVLLAVGIAYSFAMERVLPYRPQWNSSHDDAQRDVAHAFVNELLNLAVVWSMPLLAWAIPAPRPWPQELPFALQVVGAILVLDFGIAVAHFLSHRWELLWRFHAVHHSVKRLYGFNGLMKHPLHQLVELTCGSLPLALFGLPQDIAFLLVLCVSIQLLLQHSNVDYAVGPLRWLLAVNQVHRFHHLASAEDGDVNFGLFTNLFDRLAGTYLFDPEMTFRSQDLGIADRPNYPNGYVPQLVEPFR